MEQVCDGEIDLRLALGGSAFAFPITLRSLQPPLAPVTAETSPHRVLLP
jgi:hypothetical protein